MAGRTTADTDARQRAAETSVPTPRAPDALGAFRRPSEDPTLGDGRKPPTTLAWAPTPTLEDRGLLAAPAYVFVHDDARGATPGARVAEGLEALGRHVERISPNGHGRASTGPLNHPLVVHVGSTDAVLPPTAATVGQVVAAYRPGATVSYAVTTDAGEVGAEVRARVEALVARADVVTVTTGDLARLHPGEDADATVARWLRGGPGVVIVAGDDGASAANAVGVTARVSGAGLGDGPVGDAFVAGVLDALWTGGLLGVAARADLRTLVRGSLQELLDNAAAAAAVAREAGRPGTREELAAARGVPRLLTRV